MSSPTDRRSASSDVLDSPTDASNGRSAPNIPPEAPGGDLWPELGSIAPLVPGVSSSATGGGSESSSSRHGRHSARARRKSRFVYPARRWPRRILVVVNLVVAMMLISAGTVYGYFNWRFSQIKTVVIPSILHRAAASPPPPPGAPMTILVVGSDSRAGDAGGDAAQFGNAVEVGGARSDTIMLVRVIPATTTATILSIPRDLWVPIPGQGTNRINSAFDSGPDLLVRTIQQDLGISIDHYVDVDFQSFRDIVNAVGGVQEYFPTPARDAFSLLNIPAAGCYNMTGSMALSFVRSRHYEYKVDGRWQFESESDLARIERQQSFVKKMITKAQGSGLTNPIELNNIIGGITSNLTLDSGFSQSLLLSLAKRFKDLSPGTLPTSTLPTTAATIGGADVLLLQQPDDQQAIANFLNPPAPASASTATTTPPPPPDTVPPASIRVAVLNGSGRTGEATETAAGLSHQGFVVASTASAPNFNYATTVVEYQPGDLAQAQEVASKVLGTAQLQVDTTLQGAQVALITGQTFQGITTATPTTATTATTAPTTTSTTIYQLPGTPPGSVPSTC